ncbi:MAG: toxin ABC transporter [Psychromonas sp.]|nr:toxin ABC transporter [Psychromonas sp.]
MNITFANFNSKQAVLQLLLSSLFINLLSLALPFTMLQIYDRILPNHSHGTATILVIGVSFAILIEMFLRYARSWLLASSASNFELQSTINVIKKLMITKHYNLDKMGAGSILNSITSISAMRDLYSGQAVVSLIDVPFVLIFLGLVGYIGGALVFIPIAVWCLVFILVYLISKKLFAITSTLANGESAYSRLLIAILSGLGSVKSYAFEDQCVQKYKKSNYERLKLQEEVDWLSAKLQEIIQGASQATTLILVLIGSLEVLNGSLTTGGLAACSILAGRAIAPLSAIVNLRARYVSAKSAMKIVSLSTDAAEEVFLANKVYGEKLPLGPIRFEKVSYETNSSQINDLNFEIQPGQLVSIKSNSVADANLILSSVAQFHEVDDGCIYIDDVALDDHERDEFKQSVIYLSGWPKIFSGTVLENMTMFRSDLEAAAMTLSTALGLDESIARLPAGYSTKVTQSGGHILNVGTVKLIGLIRGIVQAPSILLLSEPMISLDISAQGKLVEVIKSLKGKMTIIMVDQFKALDDLVDLEIPINRKSNLYSVESEGDK